MVQPNLMMANLELTIEPLQDDFFLDKRILVILDAQSHEESAAIFFSFHDRQSFGTSLTYEYQKKYVADSQLYSK